MFLQKSHNHHSALLTNRTRKSAISDFVMLIIFVCVILAILMPSVALTAETDEISNNSEKIHEITPSATPQINILFLPLKIIAAHDSELFGSQSDETLSKALIKKGYEMILRQSVSHLYENTSWPPPLTVLKEIDRDHEAQYAVTGSLTVLGGKTSLDLTLNDLSGITDPVFYFKDSDSVADLAEMIEQLVENIHTYVNRNHLISSIKIQGNRRIDSGAITHHIKTKAGDEYNPSHLREDLKNIFRMGYFDDIQILALDTDRGKEIVFQITEKELITEITIKGSDEIKEKDIKEVILIKTNTIINPKKIRESVENIQHLYKDESLYNTKVIYEVTPSGKDRVAVNFIITESTKIYIKEITIIGNKAFDADTLKKIMETREKGWFSWITESGKLKRDILNQDATRLNAFYNNNGYIDAVVSEPEIVQKQEIVKKQETAPSNTFDDFNNFSGAGIVDGEPEIDQIHEWLYVTFKIYEGDLYKLGTVDITGELIEEKEKLMGLLKVDDDKHFSRKTLRQDVLDISDIYAEKGYAFPDINPLMQRNAAEKTIDLVIDINKGPLVHINRIIIKGNYTTRDKIIRRELEFSENGIFNTKAIRDSNQKLNRLDYFEEVHITPEQTLDENLMDIVIEVKEKMTGTFSVGVGYSSVDKAMFTGEISKDNFLGRGDKLAFKVDISGSSSQYNLSFTEPYLNDSKLMAGFDLYNWKREYDEYTKNSVGFAVRFGYPIWELWRLFWSYSYDDTEISDVDVATASQQILESMELSITSSIKISVQRITFDKPVAPKEGSKNNLSVIYAGGLFGGDSEYTKIEGASSWYFPLFWNTRLHYKLAAGIVFENVDGKLPVYEKFYLGGIRTIRGFENSHISPIDPVSGDRVGGDRMWYSNVEYIFPIAEEAGLLGVIFYDIGNVYDKELQNNYSQFRHSVGAGFRWISPVGPIRLEWGYNLKPEGNESQSNWEFSLGGAF